MQQETVVILHNIRSAHNVGAIMRTAEGAGVAMVYMTGYTPTPIDRFGKRNMDLAKTALGAEESLQWQRRAMLRTVIHALKKRGVRVVGVEQADTAIPIAKYARPVQVAYVFGNEVSGLTEREMGLCDELIELPMLGAKESLNVSAAAAIVLYRDLV
jgi:23S rRNA (guanosine2251-2'-O)-methyltransferase